MLPFPVSILVAAIASMVLGALWYSPLLFGKRFMALAGMKADQMNDPANKKLALRGYAIQFLSSLVIAFALAYFIDYAGATSIEDGGRVGFWAWLGFVATTSLAGPLWEKRPWGLYVLNVSFNLVALLIMGAILAATRPAPFLGY